MRFKKTNLSLKSHHFEMKKLKLTKLKLRSKLWDKNWSWQKKSLNGHNWESKNSDSCNYAIVKIEIYKLNVNSRIWESHNYDESKLRLNTEGLKNVNDKRNSKF